MSTAASAQDIAEIARLESETARLRAETQRLKAEQEKIAAETALKLHVEIRKLVAEASKIERETRWHPVVIVSTAVGATTALIGVIVGIVKMLLIG